jgi:hypothetical protein
MIAGDLGTLGDRADLHVLVIDVPAFLAGVGRSAGGCGQAPMIPPISSIVKPLQLRTISRRLGPRTGGPHSQAKIPVFSKQKARFGGSTATSRPIGTATRQLQCPEILSRGARLYGVSGWAIGPSRDPGRRLSPISRRPT